jgi:hypothetical protein
MKYIFMTESSPDGIFDIFNTITVPDEFAPQGSIDRWKSIIDASPIQPLIITNKENLFIGSTFDPELELFTLAENINSSLAKPLYLKNAVFLIDNVVAGIYTIPNESSLLEAAFSSPVTVMALDDNSEVEIGYTWDGTNFFAPNNSI